MSTYTPIASQTISSTTASVIFNSIPQNYTDLVLTLSVKNDGGANYNTLIRYNNDSSANYSSTYMYGTSGGFGSSRDTSQTYARGVLGNTTDFATGIINIMNYADETKAKTTLSKGGYASGILPNISLWQGTYAITSITLFNESSANFVAGSTFNLYGIVSGGGYANGGDIVTTDGTYWYHTFLSSGTFIPTQALTADYLVVAGGGGGGYRNANAGGTGGGGAGGLRSTVTATGGGGSLESALSLSANISYPVIIGAGGAAGTTPNIKGYNGSNSTFATIISVGGGGGGSTQTVSAPGANGGSGGGAGWDGTGIDVGGTGTANQGFAGGETNSGPYAGAAGGGGAGTNGANAGSNGVFGGANGGQGVAVAISGSSVYYGGGGAGGFYINGASGTGGQGGGGNSSTAGTANTGGGGGGGSGGASASAGALGGSGIVIVRYAV